jgi:hypothetical protein
MNFLIHEESFFYQFTQIISDLNARTQISFGVRQIGDRRTTVKQVKWDLDCLFVMIIGRMLRTIWSQNFEKRGVAVFRKTGIVKVSLSMLAEEEEEEVRVNVLCVVMVNEKVKGVPSPRSTGKIYSHH